MTPVGIGVLSNSDVCFNRLERKNNPDLLKATAFNYLTFLIDASRCTPAGRGKTEKHVLSPSFSNCCWRLRRTREPPENPLLCRDGPPPLHYLKACIFLTPAAMVQFLEPAELAFFLSFINRRLRDSFSGILVFLLPSAFALIPSVWTFRLTLRPVPASQFHWLVIYSTLSAMERSHNNHGNGDHLTSGRLWHRNTCEAALRQADGELNSPSEACAALLQPCALKLGRFRRFCF